LMAGTTNMSDEQARYLICLPPGRAVIYSEGDDHPYLIRMTDYKKERLAGRPSDQAIAFAMQQTIRQSWYDPVTDYNVYFSRDAELHSRALIEELVQSTMARLEFADLWHTVVLYAGVLPELMASALQRLHECLAQVIGNAAVSPVEVMVALVLHAAEATLHRLGHDLNWTYDQTEQLRKELTAGLVALVRGQKEPAQAYLSAFAERYQVLARRVYGPFVGCSVCRSRCFYRFAVRETVRNRTLQQEWHNALANPASGADMMAELAAVNRAAALRLVDEIDSRMIAGVGVCITVHMAVQQGYGRTTQILVAEEMARRIS
jgi:hypothetical protein